MGAVSEPSAGIEFGRYRLLPHRREVLADGQPLKLGGRAYDVLMMLIEAHGAVVSKDALMARIWPDRIVEENALQAQISALRAAFGAERELIRTVAGRGYQFTGEIRPPPEDIVERTDATPTDRGSALLPSNLPEPVSDLIGRHDELREALSLVADHRLVTLTGAGGIGKTRLALATARQLLLDFADGVWLAEFAPLTDPGLVPATVAAAVGLELPGEEISTERVARALASRRLLLVLDNCEHVVDAAAEMAERLLLTNPALHLIATSREPLKIDGEWVYPVPPLGVPAEGAEHDDDALGYDGVRLFLERARGAEPHFAPGQGQVATVVAICRRLDGIPLAIELAAARAAALGIEVLASGLDDRFNLLAGGRRTALPRHQTLRATLDWSHELLSDPEQMVLRRLAIFGGVFSLEAASTVASSQEINSSEVVDCLSSLIAKSLIAVEIDRTIARYRLLDTTRAYAREKLDQAGELNPVARRLAEYYVKLLQRAGSEWGTRPMTDWLADYGRQIDNLRPALDWAFSQAGEVATGVALTVASERLWFSLSLMDECRRRVEHAITRLRSGATASKSHEMRLYATLAAALFNTNGPGIETFAAWTDVLEVAERLDNTEYRLRALWGLWYNHISNGECQASLTLAQRYHTLPTNQGDPADLLVGERMLGTSLYYLGDLSNARRHLEHVLSHCTAPLRRSHMIRFQFDLPVTTRGTLARVLWLQGFPDQAMRMAEDNVEDARAIDHVVSLYWALDGVCMLALAVGDQATVERSLAMLLGYSAKHALGFWQALGHSYEGQLQIKRGNVAAGVRSLRAGLEELRKARYILRFPGLLGELAEGMARIGQHRQALEVIHEALAQCEGTDERWSMANLLRIKGKLLLLEGGLAAAAIAEDHFRQALDWARRQGALSLELRAVMDLGKLLCDQGEAPRAFALLTSVCGRFTEGFGTSDLKSAEALLEALR
jgi:predicted ATPase/DNA-binding winged helix-turn-helix (wHTH) protein